MTKFKLNFAKVSLASLLIFAISFGIWFNFASRNSENANAEGENSTNPSQNISGNYTVKEQDSISFNTRGGFVQTNVNQLGDTRVEIDFQRKDVWPEDPTEDPNTYVFGARKGPGNNTFGLFIEKKNPPSYWRLEYGNRIDAYNGTPVDDSRMFVAVDNNEFYFGTNSSDAELVFSNPDAAPTIANYFVLGGVCENFDCNATNSLGSFTGKIFSFKILKGSCSSAEFSDKTSCENAGETWSRKTVLNFVPAARYVCDGEVEYGFANDLDNDGNLANDEFFANDGTGKLSSSEEIFAEKCPVEMPEIPGIPEISETPELTKPAKPNIPSAPNTAL